MKYILSYLDLTRTLPMYLSYGIANGHPAAPLPAQVALNGLCFILHRRLSMCIGSDDDFDEDIDPSQF